MRNEHPAWKGAMLLALLGYATCSPSPWMPQMPQAFAQDGASSGNIVVLLNDKPIDFGGVPPTQIGGRVMVPLRGVFEALGATVDFDGATSTIFAVRGDTQIQLQLGSTQASLNGLPRTLDVPAQARGGRTLVPLRFVSEALGADVKWNDSLRTVSIASVLPPAGGTGPAPGRNNPRPNTPGTNPADPPYIAPSDTEQIPGVVIKLDSTPPPTLTLRDGNKIRTFTVSNNVQLYRQVSSVVATGAAPVYGPPVPISDLSRIVPNEEVRLQLDDQNEVTQITSQIIVANARVRQAQGAQIVLEDARGTALTIGANLRFVDTRGRLSQTANVQPGQTVALFIAPGTRRIYQVSTFNNDVAGSTNPAYEGPDDGGTYPPNTNTGGNNNNGNQGGTRPNNGEGAPVINLVQHTATRPLRTGASLNVTVRGTPGARGSFTVLPGAPEQALVEDVNQPGVYSGTYTVRPGDNILSGRVTALLRNDAGQETTLQSRVALTIDTVAPRITSTTPANGTTINTAEPNIVVYANDIGGSGIAKATASINNVQIPNENITIGPNSITIIPAQPLPAQNSIRVSVADAANNSVAQNWTFTVDPNAGNENLITAVTHSATRALAAGERVTVNVVASNGGQASFDVLGDNGRVIAQRLPMTEVAAGRYRGYYTIQQNQPDVQMFIKARFTDADGRSTTADATAPIALADVSDVAPVTINTPANGDKVTTPLTVRGRATANATVEISVRAEGVRYFIFEYKNELGTQQVQANGRGEWSTAPIDLPKPNNISNLHYVITAVQIDAAGRRSDPITITVN